MAKYRKKPIVIEAVRVTAADWNGSTFDGCPFSESAVPWIIAAIEEKRLVPICPGSTDYAEWEIATLEGKMKAGPGDWIIKGVKGEIYPCKPDIFAATYEPAEDAPC